MKIVCVFLSISMLILSSCSPKADVVAENPYIDRDPSNNGASAGTIAVGDGIIYFLSDAMINGKIYKYNQATGQYSHLCPDPL